MKRHSASSLTDAKRIGQIDGVGVAQLLADVVVGGILNRDKAREMAQEAWTCSPERAVSALGFRARYPLAEGLAHTIAWYRTRGVV